MYRFALLLLFYVPSFTAIAFGGEVEEVAKLAEKYSAQAEVRLYNGVRVDLLSKEYAIEADWPHKWQEAVGQSLYYAILTDKKPAIILLVTDPKNEMRDCERCQTVCAKYGIRLFIERIE